MEQRPKLYATVAFVAGILVCLGFKDFYPDLERRFRSRYRAYAPSKTLAGAGLDDEEHIDLEDHERQGAKGNDAKAVLEGIESCIGKTPLIRIKSLSDETGCEIMGKLEVLMVMYM